MREDVICVFYSIFLVLIIPLYLSIQGNIFQKSDEFTFIMTFVLGKKLVWRKEKPSNAILRQAREIECIWALETANLTSNE